MGLQHGTMNIAYTHMVHITFQVLGIIPKKYGQKQDTLVVAIHTVLRSAAQLLKMLFYLHAIITLEVAIPSIFIFILFFFFVISQSKSIQNKKKTMLQNRKLQRRSTI